MSGLPKTRGGIALHLKTIFYRARRAERGSAGVTESGVRAKKRFFRDFAAMGRVGPLVSRARFGNDKRKFQFDFGGPGTPGHPPDGPN